MPKRKKKTYRTPRVTHALKLSKKLEHYLDKAQAKYNLRRHRTVFTAYDAAQTLKMDLVAIAKTLIVQIDRELLMVVLPANRNLDMSKLKKLINKLRAKQDKTKIRKVSLASERVITNKITKNPGAVAPFGELYHIDTVVDRLLLKPRKIILNASAFTLSLEMTAKEYLRVSRAEQGSFSKARK